MEINGTITLTASDDSTVDISIVDDFIEPYQFDPTNESEVATFFTALVALDVNSLTVTFNDNASEPDIPDAPNVEAINTSRLHVRFTAPIDGGSPIISYDLRYREDGSIAWIDILNILGLGYFAHGLESGTTYEFQFKATNALGSSDYSLSGTGATLSPSKIYFEDDLITTLSHGAPSVNKMYYGDALIFGGVGADDPLPTTLTLPTTGVSFQGITILDNQYYLTAGSTIYVYNLDGTLDRTFNITGTSFSSNSFTGIDNDGTDLWLYTNSNFDNDGWLIRINTLGASQSSFDTNIPYDDSGKGIGSYNNNLMYILETRLVNSVNNGRMNYYGLPGGLRTTAILPDAFVAELSPDDYAPTSDFFNPANLSGLTVDEDGFVYVLNSDVTQVTKYELSGQRIRYRGVAINYVSDSTNEEQGDTPLGIKYDSRGYFIMISQLPNGTTYQIQVYDRYGTFIP